MLTALLISLLSTAPATGVLVPGLTFGPADAITGAPEERFVHADFNGDGLPDLLLPDAVVFQQRSGFADAPRVALPHEANNTWADVWDGQLYTSSAQRGAVFAWQDGAWVQQAQVVFDIPNADEENEMDSSRETPSAVLPQLRGFARFLHDLNGDGAAEWVLPSEEGVQIYTRTEDTYVRTALLDIYPPHRLRGLSPQPLWPAERRRISLPSIDMRTTIIVEPGRILTVWRDPAPGETSRFRAMAYDLDSENFPALTLGTTRELFDRALPNHCLPCRLNQNGQIDFAGGVSRSSSSTPFTAPVYETSASTDAGATFQTVFGRTVVPHGSFIDMDRDGALDLISEYTGLFDGGIRDAISRFITAPAIHHRVAIHRQGADGRFSEKPVITGRFRIRLEQPPAYSGPVFRKYIAGTVLSLHGDFDGDGHNDAVVQHAPDELGIYLCRDKLFATRPTHRIVLPEDFAFAVADINRDGRDDLVLYQPGNPEAADSLVWFSGQEDE